MAGNAVAAAVVVAVGAGRGGGGGGGNGIAGKCCFIDCTTIDSFRPAFCSFDCILDMCSCSYIDDCAV